MTEDQPDSSLDRGGVGMIAGLGFGLTPLMMLATIYKLSGGFDLAATSVADWVFIGLSIGLGALVGRLTLRELRWSVGVAFDDQGIRCGKQAIAWDEVERLEAPRFGILVIAGSGRELPLRTYLFRNRKALLEHIARRTGRSVPEMTYSY